MTASAPVRLGVIGVGRWGQICLRALSGITTARVVAVASTNPQTAALVPAECQIFSDWRQLIGLAGLEGAGLEGVVITTPPASHAAIAALAIESGLPVFMEKPLTLSLADANLLRGLAEAHGARVFFTDHVHLFSPAFRHLKTLVAEAGPILAVEGLAGNHGPYRQDTSVLWDWGPHDVAMLIDLFGRPPELATVRHLERRQVAQGEGETIRLDMMFGTTPATITLSTLSDKTRRFIVQCQSGTLIYDDLAPAKLTCNAHPMTLESSPPLTVALTEFAAAIRAPGSNLCGLHLGVQVVEVLERAKRSVL